jgi:hypothetical protein
MQSNFDSGALLSERKFLWCRFLLFNSDLLALPGVCVTVTYQPKPARENALFEFVRSRVPTLPHGTRIGLVEDETRYIFRES